MKKKFVATKVEKTFVENGDRKNVDLNKLAKGNKHFRRGKKILQPTKTLTLHISVGAFLGSSSSISVIFC